MFTLRRCRPIFIMFCANGCSSNGPITGIDSNTRTTIGKKVAKQVERSNP